MKRRGFINGEYQDGEARGRIFLVGTSGYGKTTEMVRLVEACEGGAVFYDHTGRHKIAGAVTVHEPGELKAQLRRRLNSRFRILYKPMAGELVDHFRAVCGIVAEVAGLVFAVDEIDEYCGPEWGQSRVPKELYRLAHFGRHAGPRSDVPGRRGVAFLYTARIPTSVARCLTSQASEIRLFHEHEPEYVRYWRGIVGAETSQAMATLPQFKFYIWKKGDAAPPVLAGGKKF